MQRWPRAHIVPHEPQFRMSVLVFVQMPPQSVRPAVQVAQVPRRHTLPEGHTVMQLPQCEGSVWRSAHEVPHAVSVPQSVVHVLPVQT